MILKETAAKHNVGGWGGYPGAFRAALGRQRGNLPTQVPVLAQLSNGLGRTRLSCFPCHNWEVNSEKQVVVYSLSIKITLTVVWEGVRGVTGGMDAQSEPVLPLFICSFPVHKDVNNMSVR